MKFIDLDGEFVDDKPLVTNEDVLKDASSLYDENQNRELLAIDPYTKAVLDNYAYAQSLKEQISLMQAMQSLQGGGGFINTGGGDVNININNNVGVGIPMGNILANFNVPASGLALGSIISDNRGMRYEVIGIDSKGKVKLQEVRDFMYSITRPEGDMSALVNHILENNDNLTDATSGVLRYFDKIGSINYNNFNDIIDATQNYVMPFASQKAQAIAYQQQQISMAMAQLKDKYVKSKDDNEKANIKEQLIQLENAKLMNDKKLQNYASFGDDLVNASVLHQLHQNMTKRKELTQSQSILAKGYEKTAYTDLFGDKRALDEKEYLDKLNEGMSKAKKEIYNQVVSQNGINITDKDIEAYSKLLLTDYDQYLNKIKALGEEGQALNKAVRQYTGNLTIKELQIKDEAFKSSLKTQRELQEKYGYGGLLSSNPLYTHTAVNEDNVLFATVPYLQYEKKGKIYSESVFLGEVGRYYGDDYGKNFVDTYGMKVAEKSGVDVPQALARGIVGSVGTAMYLGQLGGIIPANSLTLPIYNYSKRFETAYKASEKARESMFYFNDETGRLYNEGRFNVHWQNVTDALIQELPLMVVSMGGASLIKKGVEGTAKLMSSYAAHQGGKVLGMKMSGKLAERGANFMYGVANKGVKIIPTRYGGKITVPTVIGFGAPQGAEVYYEGLNEDVPYLQNLFSGMTVTVGTGMLEGLFDFDLMNQRVLKTILPTKSGANAVQQTLKNMVNENADAFMYKKIKNITDDRLFVQQKGQDVTHFRLDKTVPDEVVLVDDFIKTDKDRFINDVADWQDKTIAGKTGKAYQEDGVLYFKPDGTNNVEKYALESVNSNGLTTNEMAEAYKVAGELSRTKLQKMFDRYASNRVGRFVFGTGGKIADPILNMAGEGVTEVSQDIFTSFIETGTNAFNNALGLLSEYENAKERNEQIRKALAEKDVDFLSKLTEEEKRLFFTTGKYKKGDTELNPDELASAFFMGMVMSGVFHAGGRIMSGSPEKQFRKREEAYKKNLASIYNLDLQEKDDQETLENLYQQSFTLTRMVHLGLQDEYLHNLNKMVEAGVISKEVYKEQADFMKDYERKHFFYGDTFNKSLNKFNYDPSGKDPNAYKNITSGDIAKAMLIQSMHIKEKKIAKRNEIASFTTGLTELNNKTIGTGANKRQLTVSFVPEKMQEFIDLYTKEVSDTDQANALYSIKTDYTKAVAEERANINAITAIQKQNTNSMRKGSSNPITLHQDADLNNALVAYYENAFQSTIQNMFELGIGLADVSKSMDDLIANSAVKSEYLDFSQKVRNIEKNIVENTKKLKTSDIDNVNRGVLLFFDAYLGNIETELNAIDNVVKNNPSFKPYFDVLTNKLNLLKGTLIAEKNKVVHWAIDNLAKEIEDKKVSEGTIQEVDRVLKIASTPPPISVASTKEDVVFNNFEKELSELNKAIQEAIKNKDAVSLGTTKIDAFLENTASKFGSIKNFQKDIDAIKADKTLSMFEKIQKLKTIHDEMLQGLDDTISNPLNSKYAVATKYKTLEEISKQVELLLLTSVLQNEYLSFFDALKNIKDVDVDVVIYSTAFNLFNRAIKLARELSHDDYIKEKINGILIAQGQSVVDAERIAGRLQTLSDAERDEKEAELTALKNKIEEIKQTPEIEEILKRIREYEKSINENIGIELYSEIPFGYFSEQDTAVILRYTATQKDYDIIPIYYDDIQPVDPKDTLLKHFTPELTIAERAIVVAQNGQINQAIGNRIDGLTPEENYLITSAKIGENQLVKGGLDYDMVLADFAKAVRDYDTVLNEHLRIDDRTEIMTNLKVLLSNNILNEVANSKNLPAYSLLDYFSILQTAQRDKNRKQLYIDHLSEITQLIKAYTDEIANAQQRIAEINLKLANVSNVSEGATKNAIKDYLTWVEPITDEVAFLNTQIETLDKITNRPVEEVVKEIDDAITMSKIDELTNLGKEYYTNKDLFKKQIGLGLKKFADYYYQLKFFRDVLPKYETSISNNDLTELLGQNITNPTEKTKLAYTFFLNRIRRSISENELLNLFESSLVTEETNALTRLSNDIKSNLNKVANELEQQVTAENAVYADALNFMRNLLNNYNTLIAGEVLSKNDLKQQEPYKKLTEILLDLSYKSPDALSALNHFDAYFTFLTQQDAVRSVLVDKDMMFALLTRQYNEVGFNELYKRLNPTQKMAVSYFVDRVNTLLAKKATRIQKADTYTDLPLFLFATSSLSQHYLLHVNSYADVLSNALVDKFLSDPNIQQEFDTLSLLSTIAVYEPNSEKYYPIIELMNQKTLTGFFDVSLLDQLNIQDVANVIEELKRKKLIAENYKLVDGRYKSGEEQKVVSALDNLIKETEKIYKTALNTSVQKYNQSVLGLEDTIMSVINDPSLKDSKDVDPAFIQPIKDAFLTGYYTVVIDPNSGLPIYEIDPNQVQTIFDLYQKFLKLDNYNYIDKETDYFNTIEGRYSYTYHQRAGAMYFTHCILNGLSPVCFGEGGTGKTTSIKLAIEIINKIAVDEGKALNVVILGHTDELLQNPSLGEFSKSITIYKQTLTPDNAKDVVSSLEAMRQANKNGYNIIVLDEFLQQDEATINTLYDYLKNGVNSVIQKKPDNIAGFFVGDLFQKKKSEIGFVHSRETMPYKIVWRNNNVGLSKAMNASKAKLTIQTKDGRLDIKSAPRHVSHQELATELANNLVYSDSYGVQPVSETEFFEQLNTVSGKTKSVLLVENEEIKQEVQEKISGIPNMEVKTIDEFQGLSQETVFLYTKGMTNLDTLSASTSLYTGISRARNKVYISNHFFEENGVGNVNGLKMSDATILSSDNSLSVVFDRILNDIANEKKGWAITTTVKTKTTATAPFLFNKFPPSSSSGSGGTSGGTSKTKTTSSGAGAGAGSVTTGAGSVTTGAGTSVTTGTINIDDEISIDLLFEGVAEWGASKKGTDYVSDLNKLASNKYDSYVTSKNCIV